MIYKHIINNNIKPFCIKCDIYDIINNVNLQDIDYNKFKKIHINNINSYIKYLINKWIVFIQDIDLKFIKEYKINNIIDIFNHLNNYIPLYKLIYIINLQIYDENEIITINNDFIEYKYKYCEKFNFKITFPINNNLNDFYEIILSNVFYQINNKENSHIIKNDTYYKINDIINKFISDYDNIHFNCNIIEYKQNYIIKYYLILIVIIISLLLFFYK